jgi:hypothetical protein
MHYISIYALHNMYEFIEQYYLVDNENIVYNIIKITT